MSHLNIPSKIRGRESKDVAGFGEIRRAKFVSSKAPNANLEKFSFKRYYPVGLDIGGGNCLVVGGGRVAERKVKRLLEYGAKITVVSPDLTPRLNDLADKGAIRWFKKKFSQGDLPKSILLLFAATDDLALNRRIACKAVKRGILVNVAKPGGISTFILPAILQRSSFTVSISTHGQAPRTAKMIQEKLEPLL